MHYHSLARVVAIAIALTTWSAAAAAKAPKTRPAAGFEVGTPDEQLALDLSAVAADKGAIFVPSLSQPELEPMVIVTRGGATVARSQTGKRIPLPPGDYEVVLGHGPESWRATQAVKVVAGTTAVVNGMVGALRVGAEDAQRSPQAQTYLLISADGQRVYGPETTTSNRAYASTRTWLLPPGKYRLVWGTSKDGAQTSAIVIDGGRRLRVAGHVQSNGDVTGLRFTDTVALEPGRETTRLSWVIAASAALEHSQGQLSSFSGLALRLEAFTEIEGGIDTGEHVALGRLRLEQSWIGLEHSLGRGLPFQKVTDYLQVELSYSYRLGEIGGPYVRAVGTTSFFPTAIYMNEASLWTTENADGTVTAAAYEPGATAKLMDSFAPLILQEGVGMGFRVIKADWIELGVKVGAAARQSFYSGGRYLVASADPQNVLARELSDTQDFGFEAGVELDIHAGRWVSLRAQVDGFLPFSQVFGGDSVSPVFMFTGSAALNLNSWASLVYHATIHKDDPRLPSVQFRHGLSLRFHYSIF